MRIALATGLCLLAVAPLLAQDAATAKDPPPLRACARAIARA